MFLELDSSNKGQTIRLNQVWVDLAYYWDLLRFQPCLSHIPVLWAVHRVFPSVVARADRPRRWSGCCYGFSIDSFKIEILFRLCEARSTEDFLLGRYPFWSLHHVLTSCFVKIPICRRSWFLDTCSGVPSFLILHILVLDPLADQLCPH